MLEKNFSKYIKQNLPKDCFVQNIENGLKFSGFPDLYILYKTIPLLIELKTSIKRNKTIKDNISFKLEKSQIAWHINYNRFNGVSFILQNAPLTNDLVLFDAYLIAMSQATSTPKPEPLIIAPLKDCIEQARKIVIASMKLEP